MALLPGRSPEPAAWAAFPWGLLLTLDQSLYCSTVAKAPQGLKKQLLWLPSTVSTEPRYSKFLRVNGLCSALPSGWVFFYCSTRHPRRPSGRRRAREGFGLPCPACSFLDFSRIFPSQKDGKLRCVRRWLWALVEVNGQQSRGLCKSLPLRIPVVYFR